MNSREIAESRFDRLIRLGVDSIAGILSFFRSGLLWRTFAASRSETSSNLLHTQDHRRRNLNPRHHEVLADAGSIRYNIKV